MEIATITSYVFSCDIRRAKEMFFFFKRTISLVTRNETNQPTYFVGCNVEEIFSMEKAIFLGRKKSLW